MNRRQREFEWRPGRFKDAVLYIAEQLADDPTFGSTKLNKILYFSDTAAYRKLGRPIPALSTSATATALRRLSTNPWSES
jgi:hypothetical protein